MFSTPGGDTEQANKEWTLLKAHEVHRRNCGSENSSVPVFPDIRISDTFGILEHL